MHEFTSISVSSFEADTLTALLNEKSGDGWNVVAIVPTGSTVTAYLSKDKAEESAGSAEAKSAESADAKDAVVPAAAAAAAHDDKPVIDPVTVAATAAAISAADGGDSAKSPVDEPAGWAAGTAATGAASTPAAATPPAAAPAAAATTAAATPTPAATATPAAAATTAAAAPAGWYADPSSRYELRYWDGSAWTEHVSRAGQQFTDPPVA
jgi:hypothetical protein